MEINKKDWETALEQYKALYINELVRMDGYKYMMDLCEKRMKECEEQEDKDEMPEDIKETLKEIL